MKLKEALKNKLSKNELSNLKRSQDIIGSIAIIEIPDELKKKEKVIANTLLEIKPYVKTVLKKGKHEGKYRTQKLKWLAGEKTKEALYKENNVRMKLDVEKVYFSPRLSTERKRISEQVKKGEKILVLFSGCAPYPCVIAKNTKAKEILGIEVNPTAHKYGLENLKLNKLHNVTLVKGDVGKIEIKGKYDRIVMPAPHNAKDHLKKAFKHIKKGTIHFYTFCRAEEPKELREVKNFIKQAAGKKKFRVQKVIKCGQVGAGEFRTCFDVKV